MENKFKPENFYDYSKMNESFLNELEMLRGKWGVSMILHKGGTNEPANISKHSLDSYHYKGRAIDFHFEDGIKTIEQFILQAKIFITFLFSQPFNFGIGIYPYWNNRGYHFDNRNDKQVGWICGKLGSYSYFHNITEFDNIIDRLELCTNCKIL